MWDLLLSQFDTIGINRVTIVLAILFAIIAWESR